MDLLYLTFKIILSLLLKNMKDEDSPITIYANKIKNKIAFKIKTGYKLKLLKKETMQLLGSSKIN